MALINYYNHSTNTNFVARVVAAMSVAGVAVAGEAAGTKSAAQIAKRNALANQMLRNPASLSAAFALACTTDATIAAAIDANPGGPAIGDGAIQNAVNSLINDLAGVLATENTG